jgi:hypothetical protein
LLLFGHDDIELIHVIKGRIIAGQTLTQVKLWLQHNAPKPTPEGPISGMTAPTLDQLSVTLSPRPTSRHQSKPFNPLSLPLPSQQQQPVTSPLETTANEPADGTTEPDLVSYDNSQQLQQQLAQATMAQYKLEHPTVTPFKALASKLKETGYMPDEDEPSPETVLGIKPASTNKFVRMRQALNPKNAHTPVVAKPNPAMSSPAPLGSQSERPAQHAIVGWPHQEEIPIHSWMSPEQKQRMIRLQQALMSPRHFQPPTA